MFRKYFCLPHNWIYLVQNYFSSYVYLKDIYWYLKRIGQIQFVSELRILTGKKHPQIKLQRFRKLWIWTFGWLLHQTNFLYEALKLKQNFRKNKVVTGKTRFFVIGPFVLPILFVLTLASGRAVLCGHVAFSILVLSTKKWFSSFVKGVCVLQKTCFKV